MVGRATAVDGFYSDDNRRGRPSRGRLSNMPGRNRNVRRAPRSVFTEVDPITSQKWQQLVSPGSTDLFHSPRWMKIVAQTFGIGFGACILERNGIPSAGVAWSDLNDIFGERRVTLPFSDYSDIISESPGDIAAVMDIAMLHDVPWTLRSHDTSLDANTDWPVVRRQFVHHAIDVTPEREQLFAGLSQMARRNTLAAENRGVELVEATSKDELRAWVKLHMSLRRTKYQLLAQPYEFFENIWDEFIAPGDGFLLLARHNGQIIAGTVYLISGDTCYYKFNASDAEGLKLRPNNALMWEGMLLAKQRGQHTVDLGRTNVNQQGLLDFKASYGAGPSDMVEYAFTPPGHELAENHLNAREAVSDLTTLLTGPDVPDSIIEEAGRLLYRYFA